MTLQTGERPADERATPATAGDQLPSRQRLWRWAAVLGVGFAVAVIPRPEGVSADAWNLLAVFVATVAGLTLQPLPGGAMVLLGVGASVVLGVQPIATALSGYGDPIVWLVRKFRGGKKKTPA